MNSVQVYMEQADFDILLELSVKFNVSCSCLLNHCFCKCIDNLRAGISPEEELILRLQNTSDCLSHWH